jgi:hypothetical protein
MPTNPASAVRVRDEILALLPADHWAMPLLRQAADRAQQAVAKVEAERDAVLGELQKLQPSGSPPPGDSAILASWIRRSIVEQLAAKDAEIATLRTACEAAKEILDNQEAQEALNVSKSMPLVDLYDDRGAALKKIHEALNETSVPPKGE